MRTIPLLSLIALAALTVAGFAGEPSTDSEAAAKLVERLGSARFSVREAAAKKLLEMRGAGIPALTEGTKAGDEEVRNRCESLLVEAKTADLKDRAAAFLADPNGKLKDDPVLFAGYEKAVGKLDAGSRKLFAEMLRADLDLFILAAIRPEAVNDRIREKCKNLSKEAKEKHYVAVRGTAGELAAFFFLHERDKSTPSPWGTTGPLSHPIYHLSNPGLVDGMADKEIGPTLRRLVVQWAERRLDDDIAGRSMFIANAGLNKISEAVPFVARNANDERVQKREFMGIRMAAVWALGQIGTPEATAALEKMLPNRRLIVPSWRKEATFGDNALAAMAVARGKDPADYGLVSQAHATLQVRADGSGPLVSWKYYWFPDEDARKEGLKKLKADSAKDGAGPGK